MRNTTATFLKAHSINRSAVNLAIKVAVATVLTLALFLNDLTIIFTDAFQNEATSYLLVIPFFFGYLLFRKRRMLRAVAPIENKEQPKYFRYIATIAGTLVTATAILLYWYGSYTFTPIEYHMLALPIFTAGLVLILFNFQVLRQLAFPIAFLIFLAPPPSEILYTLGSALSSLSSEVSTALVSLAGVPLTLTSEYGNPTITMIRPDGTTLQFAVDIACSGIYSLIGFFVFAILIAYIIRDKPWKKIALILIGIPMIYLLNIMRLTTILLIGYHYGENLALQVFHLIGGSVLIFVGTLLLLLISEKAFKTKIFASKPEKCDQCNSTMQVSWNFCFTCGRIIKSASIKIHKGDIIKIIALITTVSVLLSIQAPVFALTQTPAVVITTTPMGQQASIELLPDVPDYNLQFSYRDTDFEELSKIDMALAYIYTPQNRSRKIIWVALEIASTLSGLHRWETCLINFPLSQGWKPKVTQFELKDIQLAENPAIVSRYFAFQYIKTNRTQVVLYWYESATFTVNSTSQQKNVKISLIAYPENFEELPQIESELATLAKIIVAYWKPIKTWSPIAIAISQNGAQFAEITSLLAVITVCFYGFELRKQRKINKAAYQKLSGTNKQIVDVVQETQKRTLPTLFNIVNAYEKVTDQAVDKDQFLQKLEELEKIGIIKRTLTHKHDEPILVWKALI